ncbi:MAG TPA: radical SAM protein [Dehalococcoidales bacterium]
MSEPAYLSLYRSGELQKRAEALEARLAHCNLCPRNCDVNRLEGELGFCHSGVLSIVASICAHHGEEPPLSGTKGSGTVFFGNCNMRCVYCQNHQISQDRRRLRGQETDYESLAQQLLYLQDVLGCHNINFVSPSHFVPQMVRAVLEAVPLGLRLPLVYNTSGYDSVSTLKLLDGVIDIYLPDIRYADNKVAKKYSLAPDYVEHARAAIKEMYRQVGNLIVDGEGVAQRGLIIRHLILPAGLAGSEESLTWLAREVSPDVHLSIMAQYYPAHHASRFPVLARRITRAEYDCMVALLGRLGMENGWIQALDSADNYQPDFRREGHPFQPH